uniref:sensor histidine kinase n=1 Tax=Ekhidna sp. TaxID=2608089 RepID=UPI0032EDACB9
MDCKAIPSDTLFVSGPNLESVARHATYWIDKSETKRFSNVVEALESNLFRKWEADENLNLGLNPYPLWIHLVVKNASDKTEDYWWSLYSHADTVILYRKMNTSWVPTDTAVYKLPLRERPVPTRFLATEIRLAPNETADLLLKVRNLKSPQHAFTDFTTPAHNLLWEKKFYWSIGFIVGAILLLCIFNLVLGVITSQRIFYLLSIYLATVAIVVLKEELLVVFFPGPASFSFLTRLPVISLTLIGCGLHYLVISYALENPKGRIIRAFSLVNKVGLAFGIIVTVFLFLFPGLTVEDAIYVFCWHASVVMIIALMITLFALVIFKIQKPIEALLLVPLALFLVYFNAAGYVLNYEGILTYYEITYPNYFFWAVCAEFTAYGFLLAWRYRKALNKGHAFEQERSQHQKELFQREIETQEKERMQIARDIHDDLGATVSAIKLIITNSYTHDEHLVRIVNKASNDLRYFLGNLSVTNILEDGLFNAVKQRITEVNDLQVIRFNILTQGDEQLISKELSLATYRIVSELTTNILKHSKGTTATIQLLVDDEQFQIIAEDNGLGFDVDGKHRGMGLTNIKIRVERFDGTVHIVSDKRSGTTTIINIPINHL